MSEKKKETLYNVDQISNLQELNPAQKFFVGKKYKGQSFSQKEWVKKFIKDKI